MTPRRYVVYRDPAGRIWCAPAGTKYEGEDTGLRIAFPRKCDRLRLPPRAAWDALERVYGWL